MKTPMDDGDHASRALAGTSERDPDAAAARDPRSTAELVALYAADPDADEAGTALSVIHYRGGAAEFSAAEIMARSNDPHERRVAADILAQLGWQDQTFLHESLAILARLLKDPDPVVIQAAAIACGHRSNAECIQRLVELAGHPDAAVRDGVSYGLAGCDEPHALSALMRLSGDHDRDVRDWATFALGSQTEVDTPELRRVLRARLNDSDAEVRGEALVGLARRRDACLKDAVLKELAGEFHGDWPFEAAEALADPDLIPALEGMRSRMSADVSSYFIERLDAALRACGKGDGASDGRRLTS